MNESDAIQDFLRQRGCPDEVIEGGLEGLLRDWERMVEQVEAGYDLGLDDYLNDLDGRQLVEDLLALAPPEERDEARDRLWAADVRMKGLVRSTEACLWGEAVADSEGWTPERNWWYFSLPRSPGPMLKDDLEGL
jgi:hypothetical protein